MVALLPVAATAVAWARSLGGAAVMLGVLTSLGGVLYFLTSF